MRPLAAAAALLLALVLLAGCSGGGGGPNEPEKDAQGRYVIKMTAGNQFVPANAQVPAGAKVVWVNEGGVHDITAADRSWSSDDDLGKKVGAGPAEYERTFADAGTVPYVCKIHESSGMKGTLTIA
jgi:plastocyanin